MPSGAGCGRATSSPANPSKTPCRSSLATGGSTNAVLHFLAIAHAAEVPWTIDDFERIRQRVPVLCDLKPSGRYVATDLHRAGGIPQVMKLLLNAGLLHARRITITGKTIAETLVDVPDAPRADQDVIMPLDRALYPQGHLAILKGNLSPEGCVAKITGLKNPVITGPARVFDSRTMPWRLSWPAGFSMATWW